MTDTAGLELTEVLSERDIHFLSVLERRVAAATAEHGPTGSLLDLERIAGLLDSGQPGIVLQPIVELGHRHVVGYEALSRFDLEPARSPDVWFAQGGRVGLGLELELKAIDTALGALHGLPDGAYLSVNASAPTLCSSALEAVLAGVPGERVVLELTEHEPVEDYHRLNAAVGRFRNLGFRLAVDDAGAGCAGFGHILEVSPDVIKLDRTITQSIDVHPARQHMAASLVALARGVGASVVAEGVETEAEAETLRAVGVDKGQGYLFGHPAEQAW